MDTSSSIFVIDESSTALESAIRNLKQNGNVIAVPTETIYGVACNLSEESIQSLYQIKKRDPAKPVALCVASVDDIPKYSKCTIPMELLKKLLPGPVTVVFERSELVPKQLNPHTTLIGIRVPDYEFLKKVTSSIGAIALTSANISNQESSLCIEEFKELWPKLAGIYDGGRIVSNSKAGSTVVDLSIEGKYKIIRDGMALQDTTSKLSQYGLVPA
eukprot:TRINITY_DN10982_c0_g1_i1.p1 TRINITY_DN10982_c0_g1~~TRINITY_DN10982_c0_g1_i1.p1  ORF type:complete len:230 (-),score=67.06 TRINITY_DN10982_c0_g1_i1:129-776(-)